MTRKIAIIGSTTFPLSVAIGRQVVDVMAEYGEDVVFLTRGAEGFDKFVETAALVMGRRCFAFHGGGGADNFVRDGELAVACDEMVAFFDPAALDAPYGGTGMVAERALSAGKKVRAATAVGESLVWADQ